MRGLRERIAAAPGGPRWESPERWHITLRFYGPDEPSTRGPWLRARLAGASAPRIRLAGAGTFARVLFVGVEAEVPDALRRVAGRCGAGPDYTPHLTLARGDIEGATDVVADYTGAWFWPREVALLASSGGRYTVVDRVHLGRELP